MAGHQKNTLELVQESPCHLDTLVSAMGVTAFPIERDVDGYGINA